MKINLNKVQLQQLGCIDMEKQFWNELLIVAKLNENIIGYCKVRVNNNVGNTDVFVVEKYRGNGLAGYMKQYAIDTCFNVFHCKWMKTAIYRKNKASIKAIKKQGYYAVKRYSNKKAIRFHLRNKLYTKKDDL